MHVLWRDLFRCLYRRSGSELRRVPSALWHRLWPWPWPLATLREWPRYANGHAVRTTL
ncbi:MAG: hypothetical protein F6K56_12975 [Moorea sp. SIO3G5]|nr:hypothetical protein [Moorena sp. SIO3G5]